MNRDIENPYRYTVYGKTRVKNNICSFIGTITIEKASRFKELYNGYIMGKVISNVSFYEDRGSLGSGYKKGKLTTQFCINKKGEILYDTNDSEADGFSNNQCEATWTSYRTSKTKICNWGDFRIPSSGHLDIGAGEFMVKNKYVGNGWLNYSMIFSQDKLLAKKATAAENDKWWERPDNKDKTNTLTDDGVTSNERRVGHSGNFWNDYFGIYGIKTDAKKDMIDKL